jgi:hypothetical protein
MGLFREEFSCSAAAAVFAAKEAHLLGPCGRRDEREWYVERSKYAFEDAGCAAEAEGRGDALPWHRVDLLDDGVVAVFDVRSQKIGEADSVHLVYRPRSPFYFCGWHVDDDKISAVQVENGDGTSSAGVYAYDFHKRKTTRKLTNAQVTLRSELLAQMQPALLVAPLRFRQRGPRFFSHSLCHAYSLV